MAGRNMFVAVATDLSLVVETRWYGHIALGQGSNLLNRVVNGAHEVFYDAGLLLHNK